VFNVDMDVVEVIVPKLPLPFGWLGQWLGRTPIKAFSPQDALYDSEVMSRFVGIDLGREPVPDETTILNFWSATSCAARSYET
jgi:hypothetical protein